MNSAGYNGVMQPVLVYSTVPTSDEALSLAREALQARLAACANILPNMTSLYWWEGKVEQGQEVVLILKTAHEHADALVELIRKHHSYDCPAILVVPVTGGNPDYLAWMAGETGAK